MEEDRTEIQTQKEPDTESTLNSRDPASQEDPETKKAGNADTPKEPAAGETPDTPAPSRGAPAHLFAGALFFALAVPFMEILLRVSDGNITFFSAGLIRSVLAGAALGALLLFIGSLIPKRQIGCLIAGISFLFLAVIFIAEHCCRSFFGSYYQLGFMLRMSGDIAGDFLGSSLSVLLTHWWFVLAELLPLILFLVFQKRLLPDLPGKRTRLIVCLICLVCAVLLQSANVLLCTSGEDANYYSVDYTANSAVPRFGLINTLRLEARYALFGLDRIPAGDPAESDILTETESESAEAETNEPAEDADEAGTVPLPSGEAETETPAEEEIPEEEEAVREPNVMDIDFEALIAADTSETLLQMDQYFSAQEPTLQNDYTGLFEGKNLIFFTAEAFSGTIIDEELTPALYELANSGFVFTHYYQPDWSQSTTGGEFSNLTGLIPTWIGSKTSMTVSSSDSLPLLLGWQLRELGYATTAWHDSTYTYYNRNRSHPNLGYDYYGIGNGLDIPSASTGWPASDLEMLEATIPDQIEEYLVNGTPFHAYYMTVSGHGDFSFSGNSMAKKNQAAVADIEGSEPVRAYIACQLELEYALEYLLDALYEAGIAEDTVIVLGADHYPYALATGSTDYYNELTGRNDSENYTTRYENTLILWCGSMEEPVTVDTPCSSIDILPTLSNLFGLEYDSRLLSGRDILAPDAAPGDVSTAMHVVPFADKGYGHSWVTAAGTYEAFTNTFTPNEGVTVDDTYVSRVSKLVNDRYTYAKYIISEDYYRHVLGED